MKKIFLFIFVVLFMLLLPLSVLAAETYSYTFPAPPTSWDGEDISFMFVDSLPTPGNYRYSLVLKFYNYTGYFTGLCSVISVDDGIYMAPFIFSDGSTVFSFSCMWVDLVDFKILNVTDIDSSDATFMFSGSELTLEKITTPGFIPSINSSFESVFSWIQSFTSAFFSGDLSPLLSVFLIGICIAALFFGIRFIYKTCWGC